MLKFVLCALLAAAVAEPEPGALIAPYGPLAYSSSWVAPATTTITKSASSVVHNPYYYSAYSSPIYSHFIKKRSAPLFPSSYYAPTAYIAPTYPAAPYAAASYYNSAPYLSSPYAYTAPAHFIKKRSVAPLLPLPSTYYTPTSYSYAASAPLLPSTYTAAAPVVSSAPLYASPFGYSHFIKKRSAPLLPYYAAPATYNYAASTPLLSSTYAAATPYVSAAPYYSTYPYSYSTYIKK